MANEQNLIPFTSDQDREAPKKNGKKGGVASGIARREKATMKKMLEQCLEMTNDKGQTYKELATLGLLKGAISGNATNYKAIVEMLGELAQEGGVVSHTLKVELVDNSNLEKALYEENRH